MLLLFAGLLLFAAATFVVAETATASARQRTAAIRRATRYGEMRRIGREDLRFRQRVLEPAIARLSRLTLRLNPRTSLETVEAKLLSAGMSHFSPSAFLAAKAAVAFVGGFVGLVFGGVAGGFFAVVLFAAVFACLGFVLPSAYLAMKIRSRRDAIRAQLPDALDLLAVSVEAGLGFDGAIAKLTDHLEGPLVDEFALTLSEMRIGESRHDALKKLAARAATPEVGHFTRAIIQADQLGISLGRILRVQAADSRDRRQAAAEEKANKAPIKMLFPTVAFIFPAMFLVVLGPAMLKLMEVF